MPSITIVDFDVAQLNFDYSVSAQGIEIGAIVVIAGEAIPLGSETLNRDNLIIDIVSPPYLDVWAELKAEINRSCCEVQLTGSVHYLCGERSASLPIRYGNPWPVGGSGTFSLPEVTHDQVAALKAAPRTATNGPAQLDNSPETVAEVEGWLSLAGTALAEVMDGRSPRDMLADVDRHRHWRRTSVDQARTRCRPPRCARPQQPHDRPGVGDYRRNRARARRAHHGQAGRAFAGAAGGVGVRQWTGRQRLADCRGVAFLRHSRT